jgi:hypothetical protein
MREHKAHQGVEKSRRQLIEENERRMVHSIKHPRTMMVWNERIEPDSDRDG